MGSPAPHTGSEVYTSAAPSLLADSGSSTSAESMRVEDEKEFSPNLAMSRHALLVANAFRGTLTAEGMCPKPWSIAESPEDEKDWESDLSNNQSWDGQASKSAVFSSVGSGNKVGGIRPGFERSAPSRKKFREYMSRTGARVARE